MFQISLSLFFFFFNDTATTEIYTLSLHDALPIYLGQGRVQRGGLARARGPSDQNDAVRLGQQGVEALQRIDRSEEHTSELQSPCNLVCRLLLEKKKKKLYMTNVRLIVYRVY